MIMMMAVKKMMMIFIAVVVFTPHAAIIAVRGENIFPPKLKALLLVPTFYTDCD